MAINIGGLVVGIIGIAVAILFHRKEDDAGLRRSFSCLIGMAAVVTSLAIFYIVTGR